MSMLLVLHALPSAVLLPGKWSDSRAGLQASRDALVSTLEVERLSVAKTELALAELDALIAPSKQPVLPARGYLSRTAGCYKADGSSGPPPSAMTLALNNFGRELRELTASVLPYQTRDMKRTFATDEAATYAEALKGLTLSNDAIWAREDARPSVPAPLVIRVPYLVLCGVLDTLYDGRPIARFWYLETVARIPYFAYNTMIFLYETLGWWRRSAKLKKTHFQEEWNEFHHLLIMESLGGDQAWFDRFVGQHSALAYYLITLIMWLVSPTLAYNFSELIEAHAVDTYAEFMDANEAALRDLPPPEIALAYYECGGERGGDDGICDVLDAPIGSLYDVFGRIRDDEASHAASMQTCQDPEVRGRARIVEFGALLTASAILATSVFTFETVETVESLSAPIVTQFEQRVAAEIGEVEERVLSTVEREVEREEAAFESALYKAETGR